MTQPTNTYDTYDTVGIREDLSSQIWNVDPFDTPLLSKIGKTVAKNILHEWQTDVLDTPSATNAHVDGSDTDATAITPTVRLNNRTQIFKKSWTMSGTLEATDRAGRAAENAYQAAMKAKAMKTDIESSIFANNAKVTGTSAVARELAGIPSWLTSNISAGATATEPTGDGTDARGNGTQRALTEALVKTVLAAIWDNSGEPPDTAYMGSYNKQVFSGFTGNATRFDKAEDKVLNATVDVYHSDFGRLKIVPARHIAARDMLILATKRWAWAELRPMKQEKLAKTGDSEKYQMICEGTLVCRNEKSSGGVFDLTTS